MTSSYFCFVVAGRYGGRHEPGVFACADVIYTCLEEVGYEVCICHIAEIRYGPCVGHRQNKSVATKMEGRARSVPGIGNAGGVLATCVRVRIHGYQSGPGAQETVCEGLCGGVVIIIVHIIIDVIIGRFILVVQLLLGRVGRVRFRSFPAAEEA